MKHIHLDSIAVRPTITPAKKGHDKWYDIFFLGWDNFPIDNEEPKMLFMASVNEEWMKGQAKHLLRCIKEMRDAKFKFKPHHYERFGRKAEGKGHSADLEPYVG